LRSDRAVFRCQLDRPGCNWGSLPVSKRCRNISFCARLLSTIPSANSLIFGVGEVIGLMCANFNLGAVPWDTAHQPRQGAERALSRRPYPL
jgi:hypothetical protein